MKVEGKHYDCEDCGIANARQKGVKKYTNTKSDTPGENLFIDLSTTKRG